MNKERHDFMVLLDQVKFRDWVFCVEYVGTTPLLYLVIGFSAPCAVTGEVKTQRSRKWLLSPHMTDGEVVQTAWLAVQVALEHEAREDFKFREAAIFGPHFDIGLLRELCAVNGTEVRA